MDNVKQVNEPSREDAFHDKDNKLIIPFEESLDKNIDNITYLFKNCTDVVKREVNIGMLTPIRIYGVYIDGMVNRDVLENFFLSRIIDYKNLNGERIPMTGPKTQIIMDHFSATFDIREAQNMDQMVSGILSGDAAIFIDGEKKGLIIACRSWPVRGVGAPETEAVVRGPRDGFVETIRFNTALIRRRIRDTKLKVEMTSVGTRSRTDIAIMYMEDIVRPELVEEVKTRLEKYKIDGVFDSGYIEQLIEDSWKSPFPQTQSTERPDKVASSLMEGKVAIVVDTSPFVIVVPTTLNTFYQASEDYYQRWQIMSFTRILRYIVSFLSFSLPGLYIATINFHPAMLPTSIAVSLAASREGIVLASVMEMLVMEMAFELLREAGIRLPGPVGHALGVVGGIVIGQAAVDAKLISPMIVIIVAITAVATFAIPDYGLTAAYRLLRYIFLFICALFGLYGYLIAFILLLAHLSSLESFGTPFLAPYTAGDQNDYRDFRDTLIRFPIFLQNRRPRYAREHQKTRIRLSDADSVTETPPGPDSAQTATDIQGEPREGDE
ncbi:spore germination protein [Niameybacter massiliensis]|uniref:spore germination protein n=1 Tax=Niameybacter massiliensis TaxID=1658108 RepID=UPI0006B59F47|nr:spore germination protein [Niameybacter massiliensis]